jgi:hypothetical protein
VRSRRQTSLILTGKESANGRSTVLPSMRFEAFHRPPRLSCSFARDQLQVTSRIAKQARSADVFNFCDVCTRGLTCHLSSHGLTTPRFPPVAMPSLRLKRCTCTPGPFPCNVCAVRSKDTHNPIFPPSFYSHTGRIPSPHVSPTHICTLTRENCELRSASAFPPLFAVCSTPF